MLKVIDLVYYSHNDHDKPEQVLQIHAPANAFSEFIKDKVDIQFVKHLNYEGTDTINKIKYSFFKSRNHFWYIPFKTHRYIKSQRPDIVMVEGLVFPLQLMVLKFQLGNKVKIIAQHHGEKPYSGIKRLFQKLADKATGAYLFTSIGNSEEWINKKIIKESTKCYELLEASTFFTRQKKADCKIMTGMGGDLNFLWVGNLYSNKDPITVLKGFEKYLLHMPFAKFYMIFQDEKILSEVEEIIAANVKLKKAVVLVGKIEHRSLPYWYSAADYYVSGSHKEGSGYALLEAMACGCIPIVTNIPSFNKITGDGKYGFLFSVADVDGLVKIFQQLAHIEVDTKSMEVETYFKEHLGFKQIAEELYCILNEIGKS